MKAHSEIRFRDVLPWFLLALLVTLGPYLIAWLATPPGKFLVGTLANHNDHSTYLAALRQGAEGRWLYRLNFSPEVWQPVLLLPAYMFAGRLLGWLGISYPLLLNLLRVVAVLFTLFVFLVWVRRILPDDKRQQMTAWLLIVFGGGLSWLVWPLTGSFFSFATFPDLSQPEWNFVLVSANAPHYMFGLGLETLLFLSVLRTVRANELQHNEGSSETKPAETLQWAVISAGLALLLGLTYVYHIAVVGAILGVTFLHMAWRERAIPWRRWLSGALILLPLILLLFYYMFWANRDPRWAAYVQNETHIPAPPALGLIFGLGLLGVLAVIGLITWVRRKREPLVPIWWLTTLALMYVPIVEYGERFTLGLMVPTGTLAAYGLETTLLPWLRRRGVSRALARFSPTPFQTLRRVIILLAVPSTIMASLILVQNAVLRTDFPNYMPLSELEAMEWLAGQTDPGDIVLAYYPAGNFYPAISDARVFVGQFFWTPQFEEKVASVEKFWSPETSEEWRRQFLDRWQIDYVYHGLYESRLADDRDIAIPADVVHQRGGVTIYGVRE